jgi:hypothetical protein
MSEGYRNGAFALGLITGGGIVLNLFLWCAYHSNNARESVSQDPENPQNYQNVVGSWDWFFNTFIDPQDTIAQWGMALLSLAAVYLLWETLKASRRTLDATRGMAIDTRELGEAQVVAYLSITRIDVRFFNTNTGGIFEVVPHIANSGQSPARNVCIHMLFGSDSLKTYIIDEIGAKDTHIENGIYHSIDQARHDANTMRTYISIKASLSYKTVFSKNGTVTIPQRHFYESAVFHDNATITLKRPNTVMVTVDLDEDQS